MLSGALTVIPHSDLKQDSTNLLLVQYVIANCGSLSSKFIVYMYIASSWGQLQDQARGGHAAYLLT